MDPNDNQEPRRGISRSTWVLIGFLAVAEYFVFSEPRAPFIYYLPFVLLAAYPLMHLFHGHGGHSTKRDDQPAAGAQHRH